MGSQPIICIMGGMGPKASLFFEERLMWHAAPHIGDSEKDYPDIVHFSLPSLIEDRTSFIEHKTEKHPADTPISYLDTLNDLGNRLSRDVTCVVPCNTFFSKSIYPKLDAALSQYKNLHLVHWVDALISQLKHENLNNLRALGAIGEHLDRVYADRLEAAGIDLPVVDQKLLQKVHDCIYNRDWGIKFSRNLAPAKQKFEEVLNALLLEGVENIILGCTELSLLNLGTTYHTANIIDPSDLIAKSIISEYYREQK